MINFNDEEIKLIQKQWIQIVQYQHECFGLKLFLSLFDRHPEYVILFGFQPDENYHNAERLQAHGINVMYTLNMLFDNFDDMDMVDELLFKLVRLHVMRGINQLWFDDILIPFDNVLEYFNSKLNFEHMGVLKKAFLYIKNRMQELYDDGISEILLDRSDTSDR